MHEELYDIKADVGEAHDLAGVPVYATTVQDMRVRLTPAPWAAIFSTFVGISHRCC